MRAIACLVFSFTSLLLAQSPELKSDDQQHKKLGNLNTNPFDPNSVANPYGNYGSPYSPHSATPVLPF